MSVELTSLTMRFGERTLFESVDLHVDPGECVALLGPSGVGKSTLLGIVAGYLEPTAGEVRVTVQSPVLSWVLQTPLLLNRRSALDNVAVGALSRGVPREEAEARASEALTTMGLGAQRGTKAFRLSGGERQRVAVARSLVTAPDVLLADEPTASLDPRSRELVCAALRQVALRGARVLVATHDPYVSDRCDRAVTLA